MTSDKLKNPWKTLSSKQVYQNRYYSIREDSVIRPDGTDGIYYVIDRKTAVFILALNTEKKFPLVGLFRYPTRVYSLELPGGGSEGEDSLVAAKKELKEETGIEAKTWQHIRKFQAANGLSNEMMDIFLATDLNITREYNQKEEGIMEIRWVTFQEAFGLIREGEITDSQTISCITEAALFTGEIR